MPSLLIISHTEHYKNNNGDIIGWEPTVREIDFLSNLFDRVYHIAPLYNKAPHKANIKYSSNKVIFVPIKPKGGKGIVNKVKIVFYMPYIIYKIIQLAEKCTFIHFRAPTNMGLFVLPLLLFYPKKRKWVKYAGNWKQNNIPISYYIQRWWLSKNILQSTVTINGRWKKQKKHLISFLNPCIDEKELISARKIAQSKNFSKKLNICFVGRLDQNKGIDKLIDTLTVINGFKKIESVNIVGGGSSIIRENLLLNNIHINYLGWLNRQELNKVYEISHIIILPTRSEGFPKVIAEAAAFGCIPVVTNIEPINHYIIHKQNGLLIKDLSVFNIKKCILEVDRGEYNLKKISLRAIKLATEYTFENYTKKISREIIK